MNNYCCIIDVNPTIFLQVHRAKGKAFRAEEVCCKQSEAEGLTVSVRWCRSAPEAVVVMAPS